VHAGAVREGEGFARSPGDALQPAVGAVSLHDIRSLVDVAAAGKGDEALARVVVVEDPHTLGIEVLDLSIGEGERVDP